MCKSFNLTPVAVLQYSLNPIPAEKSAPIAQHNRTLLVDSPKPHLFHPIPNSHAPHLRNQLIPRPNRRRKSRLELNQPGGIATAALAQELVAGRAVREQAVEDDAAESQLATDLIAGVEGVIVAVQPRENQSAKVHYVGGSHYR